VEADRSFQASVLEDERRQFNKFREDALRKQSTLEEQAQDKDQRLADLEAKLRSVTLELSADKQERVRAYEKLRGEMETVVHSRDNARTNASTLRRELDNAVDDARQWRMAADKLEARVRELEECNKEADKTVEAMRDKVALVEQMRTQELQDLEHIGRALHAQQRQRDDFRLHAADRLAKAARSPATAAAIAPHHQDEQVLPQLARERVAPQLQRAEPPLAVPTGLGPTPNPPLIKSPPHPQP
jgi:chromosome segregation ATPase